ncbi:zeta toxin family protein [Streptomyces sp. NPDC093801]|uniref:zeta toxin family protein n=1 Tax=Streptomyces sp. NPDC093801 TaxID=3155203 RepID=UPI00344B68EC
MHAALEQRGGAVRVERDAYEAIHPDYQHFLARDVRTAGVRVRRQTYGWQTYGWQTYGWQTYGWQAEVEARARAARYDVVAEEALADPAGWLASAGAYRAASYRVEVVALAVPEAVSQLGVVDRYLRLADEGRPRYVGWDNHDACAAALPSALADVEADHLADRVLVVRRDGQVLYTNELGPEGRWLRPTGARQALLADARRGRGRLCRRPGRRSASSTRSSSYVPGGWSGLGRHGLQTAARALEPSHRACP